MSAPLVLIELAAASGPSAHGLLMLPYFAGERTRIADPQARGIIAGLTAAGGQLNAASQPSPKGTPA